MHSCLDLIQNIKPGKMARPLIIEWNDDVVAVILYMELPHLIIRKCFDCLNWSLSPFIFSLEHMNVRIGLFRAH